MLGAWRVIAVELDDRCRWRCGLARALPRPLASCAAMREFDPDGRGRRRSPQMIVANLPYNVATRC